jgi:glutamate racemase
MQLNSSAPIGLFDSGFGGLTVLHELQQVLPTQHFVYLADNARFPYGTKGSATIQRYARECARFLVQQGVKMLVVACNTATAMALAVLEEEFPIPVVGVVAPAARAAAASTKGCVGVLATNATVATGAYERALHALRPELRVVSQPCPLFVPLVEAGLVTGEIVDKVVELYLDPIAAAQVDTVILGCTHYPLLREAIQRYLGPAVKLVESSQAVAAECSQRLLQLGELPQAADACGVTRYFVTDDVSTFNHLATSYMGTEPIRAVRIELEVTTQSPP